MEAKILKSRSDYEKALSLVANLMDAEHSSKDEEKLELYSLLIEKYEEEHFVIDLPDPIEAIKFRMEQAGLNRKDLVKFLGSQSKVSEILNRKRQLSLSMIRSLHDGLGIPAEVLLQNPQKALETNRYRIDDYPFNEMFKRGYFPSFGGNLYRAKDYAEELFIDFFTNLEKCKHEAVFCKKSVNKTNQHALNAWHARVLNISMTKELPKFSKDKLTPGIFGEIVRLSNYDGGPIIAREHLNKKGIHVIILRHLPGTYLDGACFKANMGQPVIGLTLRYDRADNFWFTLMHELAHIYLHLNKKSYVFFDDFDSIDISLKYEQEANSLTCDQMIPIDKWEQNKEVLLKDRRGAKVIEFAEEIGVSPAIIAGRIRKETEDYTRLDRLIGHKTIRKLFPQY